MEYVYWKKPAGSCWRSKPVRRGTVKALMTRHDVDLVERRSWPGRIRVLFFGNGNRVFVRNE